MRTLTQPDCHVTRACGSTTVGDRPAGRVRRSGRHRGFTVKDLAVAVTCLLIAAGLVVSVGGANRDLSQASVCTANLEVLFGGLMAYVNAYNSFPPNNPYPTYVPNGSYPGRVAGAPLLDPSLGWIMTHGLCIAPPTTYTNGHFNWTVLSEDELPDVITCPAGKREILFNPASPEIDPNSCWESTVFKYAVFYQTSGTCRAATQVVAARPDGSTDGGRNPPIPNPSVRSGERRPASNSMGGSAFVWVYAKGSVNPTDPNDIGNEQNCWLQAVHPSEVQDPSRLYYLADSREYRPQPVSQGGTDWPYAGTNNGWYAQGSPTWYRGNMVCLGTRHYGYSNVMYLDGQVNRDNQTHPSDWNMDFDPTTGKARSSQWRSSTFATWIDIANIGTQQHIMPVLTVKGWEGFFDTNGVVLRDH